MAKVIPFGAVRPREDLADKIAALPYDVYSRQEAYELVKGDEYTFLRIDRPETQFPKDYDMYAPEVYDKAKEMLYDMISNGQFIRDDKPCYYVYELVMDGRSQVGICALASVDDYINNVIKKHENTRRDKEEDRVRHVDTCNAQTGPIFLAYRQRDDINKEVAKAMQGKPVYDFTGDDNVTHRVWVISDEESISVILNAFKEIDSIYIADGHHRCASAVRVSGYRRKDNPNYSPDEEFNYFLSVIFPDNQLKIMDYNRVLKSLNGYSEDEFLEKVSDIFDVKAADNTPFAPSRKGQMGMYLKGKWYEIDTKPAMDSDNPVENLDVYKLQEYLLAPVLGIEDPKTDERIDFVGGIRGLGELERRCSLDCVCAFSMYPTDIKELFDVSDAGLLMPPKSTWFEPKLKSGLFIHTL